MNLVCYLETNRPCWPSDVCLIDRPWPAGHACISGVCCQHHHYPACWDDGNTAAAGTLRGGRAQLGASLLCCGDVVLLWACLDLRSLLSHSTTSLNTPESLNHLIHQCSLPCQRRLLTRQHWAISVCLIYSSGVSTSSLCQVDQQASWWHRETARVGWYSQIMPISHCIVMTKETIWFWVSGATMRAQYTTDGLLARYTSAATKLHCQHCIVSISLHWWVYGGRFCIHSLCFHSAYVKGGQRLGGGG